MSTIYTYPHMPIGPGAQPHDFAQASADSPYMGIYAVETTQRYVFGTRYITWDGRVFKYSRSGATCYTGQLCAFYNEESVGYTTVGDTQAIGDTQITIDSQTVAKDAWAGGYVIIYGSADNSDVQHRGIIGNTLASNSTVTVTLDGPLAVAITADSTGVEVLGNPYYDLRTGSTQFTSCAGLAAAKATTAQLFWCQTWGICWNAPSGSIYTGATNTDERQLVVDASSGAIRAHEDATYGGKSQHIGFIVQRDTSGSSGPPFIMLQISI